MQATDRIEPCAAEWFARLCDARQADRQDRYEIGSR
jgi:hypothetical protein